MKNIIKVSLLLALSINFSCKKFLEKEPDSNRVDVKNKEQIAQLLMSAYPKANYLTFAESMSDNVDDKGQGTEDVTNRMAYRFEEVNSTPNDQDSPQMYWSEAYSAIASANQALKFISEAPDSANMRGLIGEALVARAYSHFMLVQYFSQFYNASTADTDLGIPYVDEPENVVIKKYDRKTVKYVYERIEQDLLKGLDLIEDKEYEVPKYHFNRAAANAFASRFYLVLGDHAKVAKYASDAIPGNDFVNFLRPWNSSAWLAYGAADLMQNYTLATLPSNLLLAETSSVWGRYASTYRYGYIYNQISQFWRVWSICATGNPAWTFQNKLYGSTTHFYIPKLKEYFVRASINANYGQPYVMVPLFDAEEVLLNRAEAKVYLNDFAGAIADLNVYISKRITNYNPAVHVVTDARIVAYGTGLSKVDAYVKAILDIRRMEFMFQGMRWFDMQRYKLPVSHNLRELNGTIIETITLPAGDNRRVLQLPTSVILSGLELNPR